MWLVFMVLGCGGVAPPGPAAPAAVASAAPGSPAPVHLPAPAPVLPAAAVAEAHPDSHPLAADIAALRRPQQIRISPDGDRIAYVLSIPAFDPKAKPSDGDVTGGWNVEKQLFVTGRAGGDPRKLTRGKEPVLSFRWAPDGRSIAFTRKQDDKSKLHILPMDGGEAELIDTGDLEPEQFEWLASGGSIAFTAEQPLTEAQKDADFRTGRVVDEAMRYRPSHLFVMPRAGGAPRRITGGPEHIASFAASPDGMRFFVTTSRSSDPYQVSTELSPRIVDASNGALIADLEPRPRSMDSVNWAPDGRKVSYLRGDDTLSLMNALVVYDVASKKSTQVAAGLDPTIAGYAWSADSRRLTLLVRERTYSKLVRVAAGGGIVKDLGRLGRVILTDIGPTDKSGRFAAVLSTTTAEPWSPSVLELDKAAVHVIAQPNPQVSGWKLGRTEVVRWKNSEGVEIEGLVLTTPHAQAARPPALVVMPHGGPDSVSQETFHTWGQYFAARGYSVFFPNYRGSLGYGHAFYAANRGRLGEIEFKDIESGVDSLVASKKADPARLYYGSWSWGGYLTAWTIANTKRYRAAMVGAGVVDVVSQYVLSDINHGAAAQWEFKGNPWTAPERFDASNPMRLLSRVVTPTLVVHGDSDARVAPMQAMVMYRALKDMGSEVRLLRYPKEPHGFKEPAHTVHLLASWAAWFDAH